MYNLIRAELFKLRKDRSFHVLVLIIAALSLAYPLLYYIDNKSGGKPQFTGAEFLIKFVASNGYIIKFSIAALAGFFIASEYTTGVMKTVASSGNDRGRLYAAKLIGFSAGAMMISLIFPLVSLAEVSMLSGFGQLPEGVDAFFLPRVLRFTLLYTAAYAAIGALFTAMFTESGKTISFLMVFFLMINTILGGLGEYIPVFTTVYDYSVFKLLGDIGKTRIDGGDVPALLLVPLLTIVVSGLLGVLVFRKKEIK
ncbi:ABC transporter permease [Paenibacillus silagei]|uniref:ABC-2 type transport system permease protein n=1 Tax=Paenibacillus silagei TaxID=1670801 RepID=A0ABS4NK13_9BACL|nr:ABC transporter permease [Paenibacillus silagei]MBP2110377.1 ABC-2 type transport system permease protein [Paenibacillus silagei]